ncbi:hypothetical protein V500_08910 [Pseudogymnoascus sp. VKM F-4518 (FW-2643)]|nr:hypothetical protein V500_08910 [Pseudogymnoascus sp. VKM F-4518 (FW-2643)]
MSSAGSPLSVPISLRAIVLFSYLLSQVPLVQSTICYDTTGLQSEKYYPCEPDAEVSSCCSPGDICFSNGLCAPSPASKASHPKDFYVTPFYWNSCSDPTYKDPKCFSACFTEPGNGVKSCPEAGPNAYCCFGYSGCDCSDPSQVVTAIAGTIVTTIDFSVTSASSTSSSTHTSSSTSSTQALSSTSSTHVPSSTSTSSTNAPSSTSTSSTDAPSSTSISSTHDPSSTSTSEDPTATTAEPEISTPTNTPQAQESKSSALPIGVGVGVGGAVLIAIAAITVILLRRRRQRVPYLGPQLKYEYETKPGEAHYEMMTGYNAAELSGQAHWEDWVECSDSRRWLLRDDGEESRGASYGHGRGEWEGSNHIWPPAQLVVPKMGNGKLYQRLYHAYEQPQ